jgi:hypothetical protein
MRRYTGGSVRSFIRPVGLCVALIIGALPAVTLACQWACDAPDAVASSAGHHHGQQHAEPAGPADDSSDGPALRGSLHGCDYSPLLAPGITNGIFKVPSLLAIAIADISLPFVPVELRASTLSFASPSPPGARSSPLPLRI